MLLPKARRAIAYVGFALLPESTLEPLPEFVYIACPKKGHALVWLHRNGRVVGIGKGRPVVPPSPFVKLCVLVYEVDTNVGVFLQRIQIGRASCRERV